MISRSAFGGWQRRVLGVYAAKHSLINHSANMASHRCPFDVRVHVQSRVGLLAIGLIKSSWAGVVSRGPVLAVVSVTKVRLKLHLLRRGVTIVDLLHDLLELPEVVNRKAFPVQAGHLSRVFHLVFHDFLDVFEELDFFHLLLAFLYQ